MTAATSRVKPAEILAALRAFAAPGEAYELRALNVGGRGRTLHGFYDADHLDLMAAAAARLDAAGPSGVYFTPNPVRPDKAAGRLNPARPARAKAGDAAADADVVRRSWLLGDVDPVKADGHTDDSATDEEKAAAHKAMRGCLGLLADEGFVGTVSFDTGNGGSFGIPIDLPNDDEARDLVRSFLRGLAARCDRPGGKVDVKTYNAARIWKLPGTTARKGGPTPERPHRLARLLEAPGADADRRRDAETNTAVLRRLTDQWRRADREAAAAAKGTPPRNGHAAHDDGRGRLIRRAKAYCETIESAVAGEHGHDRTFRVACRLVEFGLDRGEAEGLLRDYSARCDPPWSDRELQHKLDDAFREARPDPKYAEARHGHGSNGAATAAAPVPSAATAPTAEEHLTDLGNARRVVALHGSDLRYCHPWKSFLIWDGRRWAEDQTGEAVRRVKQAQAAFYRRTAARIRELGDAGDDPGRKASLAELTAALKHALRWEEANRIAACLELVKSEPGVPVLPEQLDADPMLLNVLNGTLDLRTGRLRGHRREDLISKLAPTAYDPAAARPTWDRFLWRILGGNEGMIGYALTGSVAEQALWFLYGSGSNGKSTFLRVLLGLLGDYAMQAVSELLLARDHDSHPTERADLFGKRLVCTIEVDQGKRMAESLLKQLTGGDKISARKMYKDFFEFDPTHKLFLAANHKPVIRGTDFAVWRRIKLVPFTVTIAEAEKDRDLPAKLFAEAAGILAWAVRGCLEWQRDGMGEPEEVRQATAAYQAESDTLGEFIAARCVVQPFARVRASALLEAYAAWSGDKFTSAKRFGQQMRERGFEAERTKAGACYEGIGLGDGDGDGR